MWGKRRLQRITRYASIPFFGTEQANCALAQPRNVSREIGKRECGLKRVGRRQGRVSPLSVCASGSLRLRPQNPIESPSQRRPVGAPTCFIRSQPRARLSISLVWTVDNTSAPSSSYVPTTTRADIESSCGARSQMHRLSCHSCA